SRAARVAAHFSATTTDTPSGPTSDSHRRRPPARLLNRLTRKWTHPWPALASLSLVSLSPGALLGKDRSPATPEPIIALPRPATLPKPKLILSAWDNSSEGDRVPDPIDVHRGVGWFGQEPTFVVDHEQALVPELDVD